MHDTTTTAEQFTVEDVFDASTSRGAKDSHFWFGITLSDGGPGSAYFGNFLMTTLEEREPAWVVAWLNSLVAEHGRQAVERDLRQPGGLQIR
jgi:hypothetical protein